MIANINLSIKAKLILLDSLLQEVTSNLRDWVYILETDTETLSPLVSNTRLRPRLNILESRDFSKTEI